MLPAVEYLGHIMDCIQQLINSKLGEMHLRMPQNFTDLQAFCYYSEFLPNMAITLAPLYQLLFK